MKTHYTSIILFSLTIACATRSAFADANTLLKLLPGNAPAVTATDHFPEAWKYYKSQTETASAANDWKDVFGIDAKQLTHFVNGALVRLKSETKEGRSVNLLIAKVSDEAKCKQFLEDTSKELKEQGMRSQTKTIEGVKVSLYERSGSTSKKQKIVQCLHKQCLILADDLDIVQEVIQRLLKPADDNLISSASYKSIHAPIRGFSKTGTKLAWHLTPGLSKQSGSGVLEYGQIDEKTAKRHGLDSIRALGGTVFVDSEGNRAGYTFVYAPPPLKHTLRMFDLTPDKAIKLPTWVSQNVNSVVLMHGDFGAAMQHAGPLFDDLFAEGIEGTYEDILMDLKDPAGLGIDLKKSLFAHLGSHALLITGEVTSPKKKKVPADLIALEVSDSKKVAKTVDLLMQDDEQASKVNLADCSGWKITSEDGPDSVVAVGHGYLFLSNNVLFLKKLLESDAKVAMVQDPEVVAAKKKILDAQKRSPCLLAVAGSTAKASSDKASKTAHLHSGWSAPWNFLFQGAWFPEKKNSSTSTKKTLGGQGNDLLFIGSHRVVVGFREENGWSLFTTAPETEKSSTKATSPKGDKK